MNAIRKTEMTPWAGFRELEDNLNRIFYGQSPVRAHGAAWAPAVDVHDLGEAYVLEADLPGLRKEDITVTVKEDVVTLKGERKQQYDENQKGFRRIERYHGGFERSLRFQGGIDAGRVEATFENGVLRMHLPKPEASRPREIDVQVK